MLITKGITGEIYPNHTQFNDLIQDFGNNRFVWNDPLSKLNDQYKERKKYCKKHGIDRHKKGYSKLIPKNLRFPNKSWFNAYLTKLKKTRKWLYKTDSRALQITIQNLYDTFSNMFKGHCEAPRFKSRKYYRQSYTTSKIASQSRITTKHTLNIAKLGHMKAHLNEPITGKIKRMTITWASTGKFKVSLIVEYDNQVYLPKTGRWVGIDVGLDHLLNLSTGQKYNFKYFDKPLQYKKHKWQIRSARRRRRAVKIIRQAEHQRKRYPNVHVPELYEFHNYVKARQMVAKVSHKITTRTNDYLQKLTTMLVHRFDIICIEDLPVSRMVHNHNLARAELRACWRKFRTMLEYKCAWYGKALITVDKDYTSQVCHYCHTWCGKKDLGTRNFYCKNKKCLYHCKKLDRDTNAAINILQLGLKQIEPKTLQPVRTVF